ncbi:MAG: PDZ domain-containing protein [Hyphomicrobiaceae bacterium]
MVVTDLASTSAAARKGVKAGDIIVEVAQDPVTTIDDVRKAIEKVRKTGRKAVLLRIENAKGQMRFVAIPIQ